MLRIRTLSGDRRAHAPKLQTAVEAGRSCCDLLRSAVEEGKLSVPPCRPIRNSAGQRKAEADKLRRLERVYAP